MLSSFFHAGRANLITPPPHVRHLTLASCFVVFSRTYRSRPAVPFAFKDLMSRSACCSHRFSHFTTFFIDAGAQRSIVQSFVSFIVFFVFNDAVQQVASILHYTILYYMNMHIIYFTLSLHFTILQSHCRLNVCLPGSCHSRDLSPGRPCLPPQLSNCVKQLPEAKVAVDDPSAGSPTETLLRLVLPLDVQAHPVSPQLLNCVKQLPAKKVSPMHPSVVTTGGVYKGQGRNQR